MRVFITGASGWIGSAVTAELISAGHQVVGLVRSESKAEALRDVGGEPLLGSLSDLATLRRAASEADGVIHTAFGLDLSKITELAREDTQAIEAFGDVYIGSGRPVIITSGLFLAPPGEVFTEDMPLAPVTPEFPRASEQTAFSLAQRGVRATWVRLPRSVHGLGETHGFIPMIGSVAREKGFSAYIGDGQNLWPSVHRLDAARVFRLALEHGAAGGPFHALAEGGVPYQAPAAGRPAPGRRHRRAGGVVRLSGTGVGGRLALLLRGAGDVGRGQRPGLQRADQSTSRMGTRTPRPDPGHQPARLLPFLTTPPSSSTWQTVN